MLHGRRCALPGCLGRKGVCLSVTVCRTHALCRSVVSLDAHPYRSNIFVCQPRLYRVLVYIASVSRTPVFCHISCLCCACCDPQSVQVLGGPFQPNGPRAGCLQATTLASARVNERACIPVDYNSWPRRPRTPARCLKCNSIPSMDLLSCDSRFALR